MELLLTDEQGFLAEAASGVLARENPIAAARAALDGQARPSLWGLAVDAGWPGLLIGEDADGAGLGAYEGMLVLEACGAVLADAGLLGHLAASAELELAEADLDLRTALAAGEQRAAYADGALGALTVTRRFDRFRLDGKLEFVLDAAGADVLVIVATGPDGHDVGLLVDDLGSVSVDERLSYDATRSLSTVGFDRAWAQRLRIPDGWTAQGRDIQRTLLAAEAVGAADACLRMARDYAVDRKAFGRSIGSYQAIKHKLVEMLRRVESARSLLVYAGRTWHENPSEFTLAANAARVCAINALDYAASENIFIHGGIGATWEHDAHLFYRRAQVSRRLTGGADAAAEAVAEQLLELHSTPIYPPLADR